MKTEMVLERMLRVQQIASGLVSEYDEDDEVSSIRRLKTSPKTRATVDILEEFNGKAIIWCTMTEEIRMVIDALEAKFGAGCTTKYNGEMTKEEQDASRWRFQGREGSNPVPDDPTCRFFVANLDAGSMGLTLTKATLEIYHSNTFSYLRRMQSEDRAHRKGQTNSVVIYDLIMPGSIDEIVQDALKFKQDVSDYVHDAMDKARGAGDPWLS